MTLGDLHERMTPLELNSWHLHLSRYPPGDFLTHILLAGIYTILLNALGNKKFSVKEVAPWLEYFIKGEEKLKSNSTADVISGLVSELYERSKGEKA